MNRGGQPYYYHQNALWSAYALSDSTGTGIEGYSYDAYGYQTVTCQVLTEVLCDDGRRVFCRVLRALRQPVPVHRPAL